MHRLIAALSAGSLAFALAACGSSTHTITSPTGNKCAVTATADTPSFAAGGGSGSITVSTNRECQWTAEPSTSWVALQSGSSGQGDGKISFKVAANGDPAVRRATVNVNDQQVAISQEAAPCQFTVSPLADSVSPGGDRRSVAVTTSSAQCGWEAKSNSDWMTIESGAKGAGNGTVTYGVQATTGPPRSGSLTVAGQTVTVAQGTGCSVAISPTGEAIGASGGSGSISVTTGAGCAWTATSSEPWITLTSGSSGAGPGSVTFTVGAWNGPARTGTITVNGQVFTITQGAGCSFSLSTSSASVSAGPGSGSVQVITADGCSWNSSSNAGWLSITSGASGSGRGTVQFSVTQNTGAARDATLTIANQPFAVKQAAAACTYSINPQSAAFSDALQHSGTFALTTRSDCSWTATPSDSTWIHVSTSSGSGSASINFNIDENKTPGPVRTGSISVGGQTFSISQAAPACTYSLSPTSQNFDSGGGGGTVNVTAGGGCSWTASASQSWVHLTSGSSGSGNGAVQFTVDQNSGSARDASISVNGQTFSIHQNAGCSYALSAGSTAIGSAGGTGSVAVTTGSSCTWAASAPDAWARITSGASGTGDGTVEFTVDPNSGAARSSTLTVAGLPFTISQDAAPCTYSIDPPRTDYPDALAHTGSFTLTASRGDCGWTAVASDVWIQITSPASGVGTATINFSVTANAGPARSGSIAVAGQTFTVSQTAPPPPPPGGGGLEN